ADVPPAAAPDAQPAAQASERADAEELAAAPSLGLDARGALARALSTFDRRGRPDRTEERAANRVLQRQGLLRARRDSSRREARPCRDCAHRGALPVPG